MHARVVVIMLPMSKGKGVGSAHGKAMYEAGILDPREAQREQSASQLAAVNRTLVPSLAPHQPGVVVWYTHARQQTQNIIK